MNAFEWDGVDVHRELGELIHKVVDTDIQSRF